MHLNGRTDVLRGCVLILKIYRERTKLPNSEASIDWPNCFVYNQMDAKGVC